MKYILTMSINLAPEKSKYQSLLHKSFCEGPEIGQVKPGCWVLRKREDPHLPPVPIALISTLPTWSFSGYQCDIGKNKAGKSHAEQPCRNW